MSVLTVLFLVLWGVLLYFYSTETGGLPSEADSVISILFTQMGLQFSSTLICLMTVMLGAGAISSELETGVIHGILTRPISRIDYVAGRFLGLAVFVAAYSAVMFSMIFILANIYSLPTAASLTFGALFSGMLLYTAVPVALLCLVMLGSTLLRTVPNGLLMIFVYILGNIGGTVEMIGNAVRNDGVISSGIFISLLSPFHTLFKTAERVLLPSSGLLGELMGGVGGLSGAGRPPSVWMYVYITVYALAALVLAAYRLKKKDIA